MTYNLSCKAEKWPVVNKKILYFLNYFIYLCPRLNNLYEVLWHLPITL